MSRQLGSRDTSPDPVIKHINFHESVTAAITSALSEVTGLDEDDLGPLYHTIELDTLDQLCHDPETLEQADFQLSFTVEDCKIIIHGDGRVVVSPAIKPQHEE